MALQCLFGIEFPQHHRNDPRDRQGGAVNFLFTCGWCDTECVVWGTPVVSWWTQRYRVEDFECWWCGTTCTPHDPPWTEAD